MGGGRYLVGGGRDKKMLPPTTTLPPPGLGLMGSVLGLLCRALFTLDRAASEYEGIDLQDNIKRGGRQKQEDENHQREEDGRLDMLSWGRLR